MTFRQTSWEAVIGVFDHIGGSFIGRKLDVVDILVAKATLARNRPHEIADLVQEFKLGSESNRIAYGKFKAASASGG